MLKAVILAVIVVIVAATGIQAQVTTNRSVVACDPSVLNSGGKVVVSLGAHHGRELAIIRESDRASYFLVVQEPPKEMKPLMTRQKFSNLRRLEITEETTGFPWASDTRKNERIFSRSGRYSVIVADALESDASLQFKCVIDYVR